MTADPQTQNQTQDQTQEQTVIFNEAEDQPSVGVLGGDINLDLGDAISPNVTTGDTDVGLVDGLSILPDAADISDLDVLNALNVLPNAADGGVLNTLNVLPSAADGGVLNALNVVPGATDLADVGGVANDLALSDTLTGLNVSDILTDTADLGTGNVADDLDVLNALNGTDVGGLIGDVASTDNGGSLIGDVVGDVASTGDGGSLVSDVVGNVASPDGSLVDTVVGDVASSSDGGSLISDVVSNVASPDGALVGDIVADAASPDGAGALVSDVVNADGMIANVSDVADVVDHSSPIPGVSVADNADALGNVLNVDSIGSIADLDGNSILNDLLDTGADATGAGDLSGFLSALNDINASDLTDGIAGGNLLNDVDIGGVLSHLTGPIGGGDDFGTALDLSDVGALVSPDFATNIPVDTMADGLLSQVDLNDIADIGLGGHADHG